MKPIRRWGKNEVDQPLQHFKNEIENAFNRFFEDPFFSQSSLFNKESLTPAVNIEEKRNRYRIEVEVPGVDPEEVDIEIDGDMMTIKGEKTRETETEDEEQQMHIIEHSYGSFYRSFTLPENIDADNITAENKNGILYIDVPKIKESKPRRISIKRK